MTAPRARVMAVTGLLLIDPVVVRLLAFSLPPWPGLTTVFTYALTDGGLIALVRWFRPRVADPRPLWALFAVIPVLQAGWLLLAPSTAWVHVVLWFRALPLT
jgi:hypothetical protein